MNDQPTDEYTAIARAMRELGLQRDQPFAEPLAPDFHAELNAKLQPKPKAPDQADYGDETNWYGY